ncbi:MAG: hypothetical protein ACKO4S_03510 [Snowella sp.]
MKLITSILFSASFAIATSVNVPHVQAQELNQPQANTAQEKLNTTTKPQGFCFVTPWGRMCGG